LTGPPHTNVASFSAAASAKSLYSSYDKTDQCVGLTRHLLLLAAMACCCYYYCQLLLAGCCQLAVAASWLLLLLLD